MAQPQVLAHLHPDRREVATARRVAAEALESCDSTDAANVELLVSELVGDAVRRASGHVELIIDIQPGHIVIDVSAPTTVTPDAAPTLWFTSALATSWGSSERDGRHRTWATLRRTSSPTPE